MLWLTDMKQDGSEFTIDGYAHHADALSDFVANLEDTHVFPQAGRDRRQPGGHRRQDRRAVKFVGQGHLVDPDMPVPAAPVKPRRSEVSGSGR